MMRTTLATLLVMLLPATVVAQTNTTGTMSPNTTVIQIPPPAAPGSGVPTTTNQPTNRAPVASATTATAPTPRDVAIVLCGEELSSGASRLLVFSASTSTGGPTIAPGAPCAQALSDLFVAGFALFDVQPFNQQLQYTLAR
jgi:hypothetical protein